MFSSTLEPQFQHLFNGHNNCSHLRDVMKSWCLCICKCSWFQSLTPHDKKCLNTYETCITPVTEPLSTYLLNEWTNRITSAGGLTVSAHLQTVEELTVATCSFCAPVWFLLVHEKRILIPNYSLALITLSLNRIVNFVVIESDHRYKIYSISHKPALMKLSISHGPPSQTLI